jgi:hypothetical protein
VCLASQSFPYSNALNGVKVRFLQDDPEKKIYKKSIMAHKELTIEKNNALSPFPYHTKKNWGKSFFGKVSNH